MAIKHFVNSSMDIRHVALITTVNPKTRKIEARLKDGGEVQVSLFDVPSMFVWPKQGEYWIIRKDGGYWKLQSKFQDPNSHQIEDLGEGEAKIGADIIKTESGHDVVTIDTNNTMNVAGVKIIVGTGSPESSISAPVGSLYTQKDGSEGSVLYVKTSGTDSTGWTAVG